jgi:hypothetical protein
MVLQPPGRFYIVRRRGLRKLAYSGVWRVFTSGVAEKAALDFSSDPCRELVQI